MSDIIKPPREAGAASVTDLSSMMVPSFATRLLDGIRYVTRGKVPDWFGPLAPIPGMAPDAIAGRQFDYDVGANLRYTPKLGEGLNFTTLQKMSAMWPLLRLIIETRKDQICQMEWTIIPRDKTKRRDQKCKDLEEFLRFPDKVHSWEDWLRMILEDLLVTDTPCIYPRPARDGTLYALEPVDGTTIKRIIDDYGRTPLPPYPAYQQIIKGLPANDYTFDQLIYRPRNLRAGKMYGYSPVEQLAVTIQIALNREASVLAYYTDGSTPDLILSVPETWSPQQIATFKKWWDSILEGNVQKKRGTMFVFNGTKPLNTKEKVLADEMDEWLARICCYCFGMSPQPFIRQATRASAVTAATAAKEEGIRPYAAWVAGFINYVLAKYLDAGDYMLRFAKDVETDPLTRSQVCNLKVRGAAMTINEWRAADGQEPVDGGDTLLVYTSNGVVKLEDALAASALISVSTRESDTAAGTPGSGEQGPDGQEKPPSNANPTKASNTLATQSKGTTNKKPQSRTSNMGDGARRVVKSAEARPITPEEVALSVQIADVLQKMQKDTFLELIKAGIGNVHPNAKDLRNVDVTLASLKVTSAGMKQPVEKALEGRMNHGYRAATKAVLQKGAPVATFDASAYAAARAASLVTEIDDTTRQLIRNTVATAIEENWSQEELAKALSEQYAFSSTRAKTIAATEMNDALTHAELEAWQATGVVKAIEWTVSAAEGVCAICQDNEDAGPVELGKEFPSGDDGPPAHPNCRCSLTPVIEG